jgi:ribonuclease Z
MTFSRINRCVVALAAALFGGVAFTLWLAPDQAGNLLGIEPVRAAGASVVRSDLGGLFGGMAVLSAAAAWTMRRSWIFAAAVVLSSIVIGRSIGWVANGAVGSDVLELAIELVMIGALLSLARGSRATQRSASQPAWRSVMLAGALLVPVAGGAVFVSAGIQQRIFDRAAERQAATINRAPLEDDALRVAVCGSSAPLPSERRAKACVAVFAGGKFFVVDAGPESVENLVLWGIPLSSIGGVLLTHFHSDHIGDLGELNLQTWAGGRPAPLAVYGGPGVDRVVQGFNDAYRLDQGYRTAHHSARVMPPETWPMVPHTIELSGSETEALDRSALVLDEAGLRITAIEVNHAPISPAYAYRFDYKGRSAVVTGDLKFHPPLVSAAMNADVLVSEAIAVGMTRALGRGATEGGRDRTAAIMHDIEDYHITPEQAASIANNARVKLLVFYHLLPAPDGMLTRRVFAQGLDKARRGDWTIADDGSMYTMPLGSYDVRIGRVTE